ncbi:hypothetical protein GH714_004903 [Hevea brasiliensis]|uniref:Fibronectin type III-like domain-containing protein n=1 Tax=Hevea brasiliensis TaxID=3981 RepID=A0A6A6LWM4_HEVBR|nr:hypothetical protein GH714_004903 [Hevea brasiliensis]
MANTFLLFTYLIFIAFSAISATAGNALSTLDHDNAIPSGSNFTFVCDRSRYTSLGLNMSNFAFCDSSLSYDVRAKDLVNHMTLHEKVKQLGDNAYGVPRLGLPKYEWWSEALHGVSDIGPGTFFDDLVPAATSFPTVILTTASFNESLWRNIGQVVSTEARAMYNLGRAGLTYWSPTINVVRDPRWGRTTETPGEDPFIVGTYAANYVRGLQDIEGTENYEDLNSRPLKVSSCCKHFAAYDVDDWKGVERYTFDARVTEQDMIETFLLPFEMCVKEGDASCVMCSYNRVNGIPTCADPKLLNQTIRGDWNLHGTGFGLWDLLHQFHSKFSAAREGKGGIHRQVTNIPLCGADEGVPCRFISPIDGFSRYANVDYKIGCDVACKNESLIFPAMKAAKSADATIIVAGIDLSIEAESLDREDLLLPGYQTQFINQVANISKGPVILVIMSAGGVDISFAKSNISNIKAILWAGYPGEEGGLAIADVVFGKYNPGGRLPVTWYEAEYVDQLPMTSMQLRPDDRLGYPGRTYKFFNGSTVYPFGYGLSYTKFKYSLTSSFPSVHFKLNRFQHCYQLRYETDAFRPPCPAVLTDHLPCDDHHFNFEVEVKNVGSRDGNEVIIVYSKPPEGIVGAYIKQVIGFKRVFVQAGSSVKVKFRLNLCKSLHLIDYNAYSVLPSGGHTIVVGDDIASFPLQISFSSVEGYY